ncbi:MAG: hypothetical protein LW704_06145 [Cryomorphaceae bacterium]|nr:hypothetical protein [Cryomorphaceae bacterium]
MKYFIFFAMLSCGVAIGQQQLSDSSLQKNQEKTGKQKKHSVADRQRIKVFNAAGANAKGRLQILSPDTVIVGRQKIAFSEITRIYVYSKTFRKIGFIIGGLSGALGLYVLAIAGLGDEGPPLAVLSATTAGFLSLTLISKKFDLGDEYKAYFQKLE